MSSFSPSSPNPDTGIVEWRDAEAQAVGAVILVHGLNNMPGLMRPLADELRTRGFHTGLLGLSGHRGEGWARVNYDALWLSELDAAIAAATHRYPGLPLSLSGYSLGGTVILSALSRENAPAISRTIVFAPAVSLTFFAKLLRFLLPFRHLGAKLPALAPKKWRVYNWTAVGAYYSLGQLILSINAERLREHRICAVLDPKDELVSYRETLEWTRINDLYNFAVVSTSPDKRPKQFHLLVDPAERGEKSWGEMIEVAADFLGNTKEPPRTQRTPRL